MTATKPPRARTFLSKGSDIAERLLDLGAACVEIALRLPRHAGGKSVESQLIRCSMSAGANYEEARAAESRQDFAHNAGVAAKEARETGYWLAFIQRCGWRVPRLAEVLDESRQLAAILGASARTARKGA